MKRVVRFLLQTAVPHGKFVKSNLKAYISHYLPLGIMRLRNWRCFKSLDTMKVHYYRTEGAFNSLISLACVFNIHTLSLSHVHITRLKRVTFLCLRVVYNKNFQNLS